MSHFSYACKTEGENGISHLISALCINCLSAIPEYSSILAVRRLFKGFGGGKNQDFMIIRCPIS